MLLKIITVLLICSSAHATDTRSLQQPATEAMQATLENSALKSAIELVLKTEVGLGLKSYIEEL